VISVISIKGEQTRLEDIGTVADITRGTVDLVNPKAIEFGESVNKRVFASQCALKLYFPPELRLRNVSEMDERFTPKKADDQKAVERKDGQLTPVRRDVGDVNDETQVCYEFGVWTPSLANKNVSEAPVGPGEEAAKWQVPIQVQYEFRRLDGAVIRRVATVLAEIRTDPAEVAKTMEIRVVSVNLAQQCAQMARGGKYEAALAYATSLRAMIQPIVTTPEQRALFAAFEQEYVGIRATLTAAMDREAASAKKARGPVTVSASSRQQDRDDITAQKLYSYNQSSSAACSLM